MRKKGRTKYFLVGFLCFFIFAYGFITVNINKRNPEKKESKFTMDLTLKPFDLRVDTTNYAFYVNSKIIDDMKEKCVDIYNGIFSK